MRRAEIDLGWLGWQQADFFGTDVQAEIEKVQHFEKEQAQLFNESAEISAQVAGLEAQRTEVRTALARRLEEIASECAPAAKALAELEPQLAENNRRQGRFAAALLELHQQSESLNKRYHELSARQLPPESRAELIEVSNQRSRIPEEQNALRQSQVRVANEITKLTAEISQLRARLAAGQKTEEEMRRDFQTQEAALRERLRDCARRRKSLQKRIGALDGHKAEPFWRIGRCLADHEIKPINQPEALVLVQTLRQKMAVTRLTLNQSLAQTTPADRRSFYALVWLLLGAILLAGWLAWR